VVSSQMIDRVTANLNREPYEVPVGFKWFADGLLSGSLGFAGEESAGASFARRDGSVWTTEKDGIVLSLLAAELTARTGRDPAELYSELTRKFGTPAYERVDAPATPEQKALLAKLTPGQVRLTELAGEKILSVITSAPGNGAPLAGVKVATESGWFARDPQVPRISTKFTRRVFGGWIICAASRMKRRPSLTMPWRCSHNPGFHPGKEYPGSPGYGIRLTGRASSKIDR